MLSRKAVLGCPTHRLMQFWMLMMEGSMVTAEYKHSGVLIDCWYSTTNTLPLVQFAIPALKHFIVDCLSTTYLKY